MDKEKGNLPIQEEKVDRTGFKPSLLEQLTFPINNDKDSLFSEIERGIMFLLRGKVVQIKQQKANYLVNIETYPVINGVITPKANWVFSNISLNEGVFYEVIGVYFSSKKPNGGYAPTFVVKRAEAV